MVDLPVWVFVLIVVGATLGGGFLGAALMSLRDRDRTAAHRDNLDNLRRLEVELHDAHTASRHELDRTSELRTELDRSKTETDRLGELVEMTNQRIEVLSAEGRSAAGKLADFQTRFSDIVGLEAEIAALRVIAARVPGLDRRIAELDPSPEVVDLRENQPQPAA